MEQRGVNETANNSILEANKLSAAAKLPGDANHQPSQPQPRRPTGSADCANTNTTDNNPTAFIHYPQQPHDHHSITNDGSLSEPTLRFPRPQGNHQLAKWISASDPNIMDVTSVPVSENGLAESTYELVSGVETDVESADERYTESMTESTESLDADRHDIEVRSIASNDASDEEDEGALSEHHTEAESESVVDVTETRDEIMEGSDEVPPLEDTEQVQDTPVESDSEAESRSSMEYARAALDTPSILTPEASRILPPVDVYEEKEVQTPAEGNTTVASASAFLKAFFQNAVPSRLPPLGNKADMRSWWREIGLRDSLYDTISPPTQTPLSSLFKFIYSFCIMYFAFTLPQALYSHLGQRGSVVDMSPQNATTTVVATTTTVQVVEPTSSSTGVALIPVHESHEEEWLFGWRTPNVTFTSKGDRGVLIKVDPSMPKSWIADSGCMSLEVTRENKTVPSDHSYHGSDAILIQFAKSEAYGLVEIRLNASCRPKFEKAVKVEFGHSGILEGVYDLTRNLAQNLTGLVPAAAQEAERCLDQAQRSLRTASDTLEGSFSSLRASAYRIFDRACERNVVKEVLPDKWYKAVAQQTGRIIEQTDKIIEKTDTLIEKAAISERAHLEKVQQYLEDLDIGSVTDTIELRLLNAQISAKVWWLKVSGHKKEAAEYQSKAKDFVALVQTAKEYNKAGGKAKSTPKKVPRLSKKRKDVPKCTPQRLGRGRQGTHECKPAS